MALLLKSKCLNGDFAFGFITLGKPLGLDERILLPLLLKLAVGRAVEAGLGTPPLSTGCD